jgi:hypothetical protein
METQTYANHRHRPRLWSTGALAALVAFVLMAWVTINAATWFYVALMLMAYAIVIAIYTVRSFSLKLQDRIIRLEMQTRLARLGREADLGSLSLRQIVALRFASDAELPAPQIRLSGRLRPGRPI